MNEQNNSYPPNSLEVPLTGTPHLPTAVQYKISFCIICMNRLYHLKRTLIQNILDNIDYDPLEIILLDYNSQDNMEGWVKENLSGYINSGTITYYKTFEPEVFNHSHSKNLSFKMAAGDIVCNINADVFVGTRFAAYINSCFRECPDIFMYPEPGGRFPPGASGIVCVNKKDFLDIEGFDEKMLVYGWEDTDFLNRLEFSGRRRHMIDNNAFLKVIDHPDKYDKARQRSRIQAIYIDQVDPVNAIQSKVLFLFKDQTFRSGTIVNNLIRSAWDPVHAQLFSARKYQFQFELVEENWVDGNWQEGNEGIALLHKEGGVKDTLRYNGKQILNSATDRQIFYQVVNSDLLDKLVYFEMDYSNRMVMLNNEKRRNVKVNKGVFGQGTVFRNFDYDTPIYV